MAHDYCYHHNGLTPGLTQQGCDQRLLRDLTALCAAPQSARRDGFDRDTCEQQAAMSYVAVRSCGATAFAVQNTEVDIPAYQPVQQRLQLSDAALGSGVAEQAEALLQRLGLDD